MENPRSERFELAREMEEHFTAFLDAADRWHRSVGVDGESATGHVRAQLATTRPMLTTILARLAQVFGKSGLPHGVTMGPTRPLDEIDRKQVGAALS